MTYKIILKNGQIIEDIPYSIPFEDALNRVKKGVPNISDDDLPNSYFIDLPNGQSVAFLSSVSIPEARVILSKQYPDFSIYNSTKNME